MDLDFSHSTALVCGASQGIGSATAIELASLGCEIIALARTEQKLHELIETLPCNNGQNHRYIVADMSARPHLRSLIATELKQLGSDSSIDILINNTGGPPAPGPVTEASESEFTCAFEQHLQVFALLSQLVLPNMKKNNYGRIINIISSSVKAPIANLGVSNTVNWAVAGWAKTLAQEVAEFGITVNSILPSFIETPGLEKFLEYESLIRNAELTETSQALIQNIPTKRFGRTQEAAAAVAFLASPAASYINGVALPVDGGWLTCY